MNKGFIYTISVFFIFTVFLELLAYTAEYHERIRHDSEVLSDAEALLWRLESAKSMSLQSLGVGIRAARNSTNISISVQDDGFPLSANSDGMVNASALSNALSNLSTYGNFTITPSLALINFSGRIIQSEIMNYSQNNSASNSDSATISLDSSDSVRGYFIRVICNVPSASSISIHAWNDTSGGSGTMDSAFTSLSPPTSSSTSLATMDYSKSHGFEASYIGASGWLGSVNMSYAPGAAANTLAIYTVVNTSAASKSDFVCSFNITANVTDTSTSSPILFKIPLSVATRYQNASYSGNLTVQKI